MQKPRPLPTRPGHHAGSEREAGRVRAGVRGLSSVRGAPSELGDQEAAHAGLPCTAPVRPHKASGLNVRLRGSSGHEGPRGSPRVPGHVGGVPVVLSCSACRLVFLRVGGARAWMGAACVGSASRFPARGKRRCPGGAGRARLPLTLRPADTSTRAPRWTRPAGTGALAGRAPAHW